MNNKDTAWKQKCDGNGRQMPPEDDGQSDPLASQMNQTLNKIQSFQ